MFQKEKSFATVIFHIGLTEINMQIIEKNGGIV
jgi:hypothetical protein